MPSATSANVRLLFGSLDSVSNSAKKVTGSQTSASATLASVRFTAAISGKCLRMTMTTLWITPMTVKMSVATMRKPRMS